MIRSFIVRLLRRCGYELVRTRQIDVARTTLANFEVYTERSGYLRHRYHAGRRARDLVRRVRRTLGEMVVA